MIETSGAIGAEPGLAAPKQQLAHPPRVFHSIPTEEAQQLDRALCEASDVEIGYFVYISLYAQRRAAGSRAGCAAAWQCGGQQIDPRSRRECCSCRLEPAAQ